MSWERFYQLEHDGPWARGLTGIRAGSLTCTATYPACEKNRFSLSLDLRWRPLAVLPGIWSTTEIRSAAWRVFLSSSYGNSHPVDTIPWTFLETKRSFFAARQYLQILISRSSKIFASFVRNAYVKGEREKKRDIVVSFRIPPIWLRFISVIDAEGASTDRGGKNLFHPSSFFLSSPREQKREFRNETKRINKVDQT